MGPTLEELIHKINHMAKEREWEKFHSPKNIAMSLIAEAAEIVEHFTWRSEAESCDLDMETLNQVSEEIGDVFINLLHLSSKLGIDLMSAASQKLEAIKKKYPVDVYKGRHS